MMPPIYVRLGLHNAAAVAIRPIKCHKGIGIGYYNECLLMIDDVVIQIFFVRGRDVVLLRGAVPCSLVCRSVRAERFERRTRLQHMSMPCADDSLSRVRRSRLGTARAQEPDSRRQGPQQEVQ